MKKLGRIVAFAFLLVLLLGLLRLNQSVYFEPSRATVDRQVVNESLLKELRFLKSAMANGAATDMQAHYPEGYVFMNALYALAWCEFSQSLKPPSALHREAHAEIERATQALLSTEASATFDGSLPLPFGAFYNGWATYVLGKKIGAANLPASHAAVREFNKRCDEIAGALRAQPSPHLASYAGGAWPADGMVCVAALALHDRQFKPKYRQTIQQWTNDVKQRLDSHGLIPHAVDAASGKVQEPARGSSQSLMLIFLSEIDPAFGRQQFKVYKKLFVAHRLGLPAIREYPAGTFGMGDVDSGPVIFGVGGAASLVGVRTMKLYGETTLAEGLRNSIEGFGWPTENDSTKKYLLGTWPMADAFIAWTDATAADADAKPGHNWRRRFHFYSGCISAVALVLMILLLRRKRKKGRSPAGKPEGKRDGLTETGRSSAT